MSFERDHRILSLRPPGGPARLRLAADAPPTATSGSGDNEGVEALAAGRDGALIAGSEGGDIRRLAGGALGRDRLAPEPPRRLQPHRPGRARPAATGSPSTAPGTRSATPRIVVAALPQPRCIRAPCVAPHGRIDLARLERPLTVDNIEAIAAVPLKGGGWRLYLLSDDNFRASQRTLLLAFDWNRGSLSISQSSSSPVGAADPGIHADQTPLGSLRSLTRASAWVPGSPFGRPG